MKQSFSMLLGCSLLCVVVYGSFEFPQVKTSLSKKAEDYLNSISTQQWQDIVDFGVESVVRQKGHERILVSSHISVKNGSISHKQLLDTLPNDKAKEDSEVAKQILAASVLTYNGKCLQNGVSASDCADYLKRKVLPRGSVLGEQCARIVQSRRDGHHPFRRLLPKNYKDGLIQMFPDEKLPPPREISSKTLSDKSATLLDDSDKTLALVQWTQFIEHDLSKPVVTSMSDGSPIECCNTENYKIQPRFLHSSCAPLLSTSLNDNRLPTCLNYVRSALAVGSKCTFGDVEQLNQATATLDLSQLYGFTDRAQQHMRSYTDGEIKSSRSTASSLDLLPIATDNSNQFCAFTSHHGNSTCFIAGDSRVNTNPFSIVLYTIFMRNHNRIAEQLKSKYSKWNDERLFEMAKAINVNIYRKIVFYEWLQKVLGETVATEINRNTHQANDDISQVSNEFAVAAIRFYLSMMPNSLQNFNNDGHKTKGANIPEIVNGQNNIQPEQNLFVLSEQNFKPDLKYTSLQLNLILKSLLQQRAMKMDAVYEESLVFSNLNSIKPTHNDILAFDIQRGRDHGLQGYVQYLEACVHIKINDWNDFEKVMSKENVDKLKDMYKNWSDIDLVIGGISEKTTDGATVGPTFSCIIAEQFSKINQWQSTFVSVTNEVAELEHFNNITAADLLCLNSDLDVVPKNIFQMVSERNPLISCDTRRRMLSF